MPIVLRFPEMLQNLKPYAKFFSLPDHQKKTLVKFHFEGNLWKGINIFLKSIRILIFCKNCVRLIKSCLLFVSFEMGNLKEILEKESIFFIKYKRIYNFLKILRSYIKSCIPFSGFLLIWNFQGSFSMISFDKSYFSIEDKSAVLVPLCPHNNNRDNSVVLEYDDKLLCWLFI